MKNKIIIRRNPFVMLKQIIILEILIGFAYFIPSILVNQNFLLIKTSDLYSEIYFMIFSISLQIVLISLVFVRWYLTKYIITKSKIIIIRNFISKQEDNYKINNVYSISLSQNFYNKLFNSGSLIGKDKNGEQIFKLKDIPDPAYHLSLIEQMDNSDETEKNLVKYTKQNIKEIIKIGENQHIEFKSTFVWDLRKKTSNKIIQHSVMKTIAGFLNTNGGMLLIGVDDKGNVLSLNDDIKNLKKKDLDGFENLFNLVFTNMIGLEFRNYIEVSFEKISKKDVCVVTVKRSPKPVYIKNKKEEEFYIRAGNTTHPLRISEATRYIEEHFKKL